MADNELEVAAEVIEEPSDQLVVSFTPSLIRANFAALDAHVEELLAPYCDAEYDLTTPENIKAAKADRKYLNGLHKELEERRRAVKRDYMRPLDEFERQLAPITGKVKAASDRIKRGLDEAEDRRRAAKRAELEAHYEDMAGLLAPVVPYERLHEEQWLNKTYAMAKAEGELEAKVERLAQDWETLKAQREGTPHYELAERELFRTLDLGAALTAARVADEEDARIATLREATERRPEPEAPEVEMEGGPNGGDWDGGHGEPYADEPVPPRETAVEPAPVVAQAPEPEPAPPAPEPAPEPAPPAPVAGDAPRPWVMVIPAATRAQVMALARDARVYGVSGEMRSGTLAEVYERSVASGR